MPILLFFSDSYFACLHLFEALFPCFFLSFIIFFFLKFLEIFLFFELGFDLGAKGDFFHLLFPYSVLTLSSFSLPFYVFISVAFLPITTSVRETEVFGFYFDSVPPSFSLSFIFY